MEQKPGLVVQSLWEMDSLCQEPQLKKVVFYDRGDQWVKSTSTVEAHTEAFDNKIKIRT